MSREAIESFIDEIRDVVPKIRRALAIIHACPEDREELIEVHRLAHSIKGTAMLVELPALSSIAMKQELLFEQILESRLSMDDRLRDSLERLTDIYEAFANGLLIGDVPEQKLQSDAIALFERHLPIESPTNAAVGRSLMPVVVVTTATESAAEMGKGTRPTSDETMRFVESSNDEMSVDSPSNNDRHLLVCDEGIQTSLAVELEAPFHIVSDESINETSSVSELMRVQAFDERLRILTNSAAGEDGDNAERIAAEDQATRDDDALFYETSVEHLQVMAYKLDQFRRDLTRWDLLADVRRRIHSLKGAASICGLHEFAHLAHHAEDLLQRMLDWTVPPTESSVDCLQACVDALEQWLDNKFDDSLLQLLHERLDEMCGGRPAPLSSMATSAADTNNVENSPRTSFGQDSLQDGVERPNAGGTLELGFVEESYGGNVGPTERSDELLIPTISQGTLPHAFLSVPLTKSGPAAIQLDDHETLAGEMLEVFTEEAEDHLRQIYTAFAGLEKQPGNMSFVQDVRRSAHTIKGAAGSVGLRQVSKLAHRMEDLLDGLFETQQQVTPSTLALLYDTTDTLQDLVHGNFTPPEMQVTIARLYDSYEIALNSPVEMTFTATVDDAIVDEGERTSEIQATEDVEATAVGVTVEDVGSQVDEAATTETFDNVMSLGDEVLVSLDRPIDLFSPNAIGVNFQESVEIETAEVIKGSVVEDARAADAAAVSSESSLVSRAASVPGPSEDTNFPGADAALIAGTRGVVDNASHVVQKLEDHRGKLVGVEAINKPIDQSLVTAVMPSLAVWSRLPLPIADASGGANIAEEKKSNETLRVPVERIDSLVREVGELIINRSSFEQRMADFAHCVEEIRRAVERLRGTSHTLDTKYGVGALGGRRRLWGDGASLLPGGSRRHGQKNEEFDAIELDRYSEFHLLSRSLAETTTDIGTVGQELQNLIGDFDQLLNRQGRLSRGTQDRLMRIRMVPLAVLATRLHRTVRVVSGQLGKQIDFLIQGGETEFDKMALEELADPLMHILRNAVDHGIESIEHRLTVGKPQQAMITVQAFYQGTQAVLQVTDDGSGLDLNAIRETAIRNGLVTPEAASSFSEQELSAFIFLPGFSTARELSEVSGRGVGMDIVRDKVLKLKGTVSVESQAGQGTTITIRLPMTLAVTRALLLHASNETFALPLQSVTKIVRLDRDKIEYVDGSPIVRMGESTLPLIYLSERLRLRLPQDKTSAVLPVLIVSSGDERAAIAVEKISHGRDIVVKPLGSHLRRVPGLIGATLLGDGSVIPILDAAGLVGHAGTVTRATPVNQELPTNLTTEMRRIAKIPSTSIRHEQPIIMVVDDSVSVRRVMLNLLKKTGWTVIDAKDGMDAIEKLHQAPQQPDLFLLDIEMPRMDGYELLSSLRSSSEHRETPIVMVTSRAGDKHRKKAMHLGASDYVIKPYQEDQLLTLIRRLLAREPILM